MRSIILYKQLRENAGTFVRVAFLVLTIRAVLLGYAWTVFQRLHPPTTALVEGGSFEDFLHIWRRWDGQAYLEIAADGYEGRHLNDDRRTFNSRFPPLYPLAIRAASLISPFNLSTTAMLLSVIFLVCASYLLFRLVEYELLDRRAAWWAVIYLNTFPASYFANAVYAESLFLLISFLYLGAVRRKGGLAQETLYLTLMLLTRQVAMAIVPFHVLRAVKQAAKSRRNKARTFWSIFLGIVPIIFYACFIIYTQNILNLPGYRAAANQRIQYVFPFSETAFAITKMAFSSDWRQSDYFMFTEGWPSMFLGLTVVISAAAAFFVPFEYTIFAFSYLGLLSVIHWNIGAHRYCFGLATLPIALVSVFRNIGRPAVLVFFLIFLWCFTDVYIEKWLLM